MTYVLCLQTLCLLIGEISLFLEVVELGFLNIYLFILSAVNLALPRARYKIGPRNVLFSFIEQIVSERR